MTAILIPTKVPISYPSGLLSRAMQTSLSKLQLSIKLFTTEVNHAHGLKLWNVSASPGHEFSTHIKPLVISASGDWQVPSASSSPEFCNNNNKIHIHKMTVLIEQSGARQVLGSNPYYCGAYWTKTLKPVIKFNWKLLWPLNNDRHNIFAFRKGLLPWYDNTRNTQIKLAKKG